MDDIETATETANNTAISSERKTLITAGIVSSYVATHALSPTELSQLIGDVHATLERLAADPIGKMPLPAVPITKSVTPDYIICLEDGLKFKSLKRHLVTSYNMTVDEYRSKWGLPRDYPLVAPNYRARRSEMAKQFGLGKSRESRQKKAQ